MHCGAKDANRLKIQGGKRYTMQTVAKIRAEIK
jgi:hypothetical protein